MSKLVSAIFKTHPNARAAVDQLLRAGFPRGDISILMADASAASQPPVARAETRAPEGAATGAAIGSILGAVTAGLAAVGTIAAPGLGLIAAGPLVAALAGAGAGGATGGVIGAVIGAGLPEPQARVVVEEIREGSVLVGIHVPDTNVELAGDVLAEAGGRRIQAE